MIDINALRGNYILRDSDPDFSLGRRAQLTYAVESLYVYLTTINPQGPDPLEYLDYAKRDNASNNRHGAINAIGNAKRAIHLTIEKLLEVLGLTKALSSLNFPARLRVMTELGAFPTRMILALNKERNLMEHEYVHVEPDRADEVVELAELFLCVAYPYLKHAVVGAFIGVEGENGCQEWYIDLGKAEVVIRDIPTDHYVDLPIGPVHYNIQRPGDIAPRFTVPISRTNQNEWFPYLDLFVYCTKRTALRLPKPDERGPGMYYAIHQIRF